MTRTFRCEAWGDPDTWTVVPESHVWAAVRANGGPGQMTKRGYRVGPWVFARMP